MPFENVTQRVAFLAFKSLTTTTFFQFLIRYVGHDILDSYLCSFAGGKTGESEIILQCDQHHVASLRHSICANFALEWCH